MRYEVTIRGGFAFKAAPGDLGKDDEPIVILGLGRRFVWHPIREAPDVYGNCAPVVSVVQPDGDAEAAGLAVNRFLSALSYAIRQPIGIGWAVATGFKDELDTPMACDPALTARLHIAPVRSIEVADDLRLHQVLGLYREGHAAESPFYGFLATHNALVTAFDGSENAAEEYARVSQGQLVDVPDGVEDLGAYFRETMRNAIAHTVRRDQSLPVLDPDSPVDRSKAANAITPLRNLVMLKVGERWPEGIQVT